MLYTGSSVLCFKISIMSNIKFWKKDVRKALSSKYSSLRLICFSSKFKAENCWAISLLMGQTFLGMMNLVKIEVQFCIIFGGCISDRLNTVGGKDVCDVSLISGTAICGVQYIGGHKGKHWISYKL